MRLNYFYFFFILSLYHIHQKKKKEEEKKNTIILNYRDKWFGYKFSYLKLSINLFIRN